MNALDGFCRQSVESTATEDVLVADVPVPLVYLRGQGLANFEEVVSLLDDWEFASNAWADHQDASQAHGGEAQARIVLRSAFSRPSLLGACLFGACLLARRRRRLQPVFSAAENILAALVHQFFGVVYPLSHDVGAVPRGVPRDWDPDLVWHFFEKAKRFRATLSTAVRMSELAPDLVPDTSGGTTIYWMRKFLAMYARKRGLGFKGVRHISVAIDPSSYSGEELMPGTAYSWENDVTAALPVKVPPPALTPADITGVIATAALTPADITNSFGCWSSPILLLYYISTAALSLAKSILSQANAPPPILI